MKRILDLSRVLALLALCLTVSDLVPVLPAHAYSSYTGQQHMYVNGPARRILRRNTRRRWVIGAIILTRPADCTRFEKNGYIYWQCGDEYLKEVEGEGNSTQYEAVEEP